MVVLDATIVNVALPSIQADLGFTPPTCSGSSTPTRSLFGGFLLLGGRAGRPLRRASGSSSPASPSSRVASLLNGLAHSASMLIVARGAAGPRRRAGLPRRAVDHHDDVRGGPGAHEGARRLERDRRRRRRLRPAARRHPDRRCSRWEWIFFVNVPVGIAAVACCAALRPRVARAERPDARFDLAGAVTVTAGLIVLVYAIVKAEDCGWGSAQHARPRARSRSRCWPRSWSSSSARRRRWSGSGSSAMRSLRGRQRACCCSSPAACSRCSSSPRSTCSRSSATRRSRRASRSCR